MIDATKFDAISFDVYGTILNWEPEIAAFLHDWAMVHDLDVGIDELLQAYDHLRQPLQNKRPALRYPEVLAQTLEIWPLSAVVFCDYIRRLGWCKPRLLRLLEDLAKGIRLHAERSRV